MQHLLTTEVNIYPGFSRFSYRVYITTQESLPAARYWKASGKMQLQNFKFSLNCTVHCHAIGKREENQFWEQLTCFLPNSDTFSHLFRHVRNGRPQVLVVRPETVSYEYCLVFAVSAYPRVIGSSFAIPAEATTAPDSTRARVDRTAWQAIYFTESTLRTIVHIHHPLLQASAQCN